MVKSPIVGADDPVTKSMMILLDDAIDAIPVVHDGKIVGIIGRRELLKQGIQEN
jgi:CBS domain-containing protein